jgi:hypothetical protein
MVAQLVNNFTAFMKPCPQKPVVVQYFDLFKPVEVSTPSLWQIYFEIVLTF